MCVFSVPVDPDDQHPREQLLLYQGGRGVRHSRGIVGPFRAELDLRDEKPESRRDRYVVYLYFS